MRGRTWKWTLLAAFVFGGGPSLGEAAPRPAKGKPDKSKPNKSPPRLDAYKEAALAIAVSSVQGLELAAKTLEQKDKAEEHWKKVYKDEKKAPQQETEHMLLYGSVPSRTLKEVGGVMEKQYELARRTLGMEKEEPWPGKLTIYFFSERSKFTSFIRTVEGRRPESDDLGSFNIRSEYPHVAAGPPTEESDPSLEVQAAEQLASALLVKKAGKSVPDWLVSGFGRATFYRAASARERNAERARARKLIAGKGPTAMAVWDGTVKGEAATVLRGSLVDFLAYGPGKSRFVPFLMAFQPEEGAQEKTVADALKAARMSAKVVNQKWKVWVRSGR